MKSKYITLILFIVLGFFSTGCSDNLNMEQHGVLSYNTYYKTDAEAETAITTIYIKLRSMEYNYKMLKNMLSDDFWAGGGGRGDNSQLEALNEYTFDAGQDFLKSVFESYYGIIYASNVALGHIPEETDVQKQMRAEAKVFRAFAYFELISMWGTPPLVDHELKASEYNQPNGSPETLWNLVNTDLTEAINSNYLTQKSNIDDNTNYRVTKQFAQALLGKAYLWQKKYKEAAEQLNAVINSGLYGLYQEDYSDILAYDHKNNRESVFESNRVDDATNVWDNSSVYQLMIGWRTDCMTISSDVYSSGWGFCNPRKSLYDAFVAEEGTDGYRLNETMKTYPQMIKLGNTINSGKTIISEGYFTWKIRVKKGEVPAAGYGFADNNNVRWMRYAEVLLLAAEANLNSDNQLLADKYLNEVRTRAKVATKTGVTLDDIVNEKRLELCFECTRYQDLIRWGLGEKFMGTQGLNCPILDSNGNVTYKSYNSEGKYGFKERNNLLPFPSTEVNLNTNIVQNTGW
jgi:hypothetical protein